MGCLEHPETTLLPTFPQYYFPLLVAPDAGTAPRMRKSTFQSQGAHRSVECLFLGRHELSPSHLGQGTWDRAMRRLHSVFLDEMWNLLRFHSDDSGSCTTKKSTPAWVTTHTSSVYPYSPARRQLPRRVFPFPHPATVYQ